MRFCQRCNVKGVGLQIECRAGYSRLCDRRSPAIECSKIVNAVRLDRRARSAPMLYRQPHPISVIEFSFTWTPISDAKHPLYTGQCGLLARHLVVDRNRFFQFLRRRFDLPQRTCQSGLSLLCGRVQINSQVLQVQCPQPRRFHPNQLPLFAGDTHTAIH
jgi:hypothetical protein